MASPDGDVTPHSVEPPTDRHGERIDAELAAFDIDAMTALAQFELRHDRILSMQALYRRRSA